MDQAIFGVRTDMACNAVMSLIAFLGLVHFRIMLAAAVRGRSRRSDDGGVDNSAAVQHQATLSEHGTDGLKEFLG